MTGDWDLRRLFTSSAQRAVSCSEASGSLSDGDLETRVVREPGDEGSDGDLETRVVRESGDEGSEGDLETRGVMETWRRG